MKSLGRVIKARLAPVRQFASHYGWWLLLVAVTAAGGTLLEQGPPPVVAAGDQDSARTWSIQWTDTDCRSCHEVTQPLFNHPVDVRPSMAIPNAMPLERGRLACTTCHEADVNAHARSRQAHDGMLRDGGTPGTAFCASCHGGESTGHTTGIGKAHLQWQDRSASGSAGSDMFGSPLGTATSLHSETNTCLSCHDGGMAHDIGNSHPVGVEYRPNFSDDRTRDMVDVAHLDSRIRLFNGQLGCGSCHSPYADTDMLLVMTNQRGELCKSCHDMR